ncbi:MAG: hypothetical protein ACK5MK_15325 [Dysgonomonas sp.]
MNKFLSKTILFLLPVIVIIIGMETLLRYVPNDYSLKKEYLDSNARHIKILILGNSHAEFGIDPDCFSRQAYNAGNVSQTLDIDYLILEKYKNQLDSLAYILIPVSYDVMYERLGNEKESWRAAYYNLYFDIPAEKNVLKINAYNTGSGKINAKRIYRYFLFNDSIDVHIEHNGMVKNDPATDTLNLRKKALEAAKRHTTDNLDKNFEDNVNYLKKIINIAKSKKTKILFFTPPAHIYYREALNKTQMQKIYDLMPQLVDNKNVFFYNLMDNNYSLEDFKDGDHLSYKGAKKFSNTLDSLISIIEENRY